MGDHQGLLTSEREPMRLSTEETAAADSHPGWQLRSLRIDKLEYSAAFERTSVALLDAFVRRLLHRVNNERRNRSRAARFRRPKDMALALDEQKAGNRISLTQTSRPRP